MPEPTTLKLQDLILTCGICGVTQKAFPAFHVAGRTTTELSDELIKRAMAEEPDGWTRMEYKAEKFSVAVCAACAQYRATRVAGAVIPLPAFNASARCTKCSGTDISTQFCRGLTPQCGHGPGRDHMHRQCRRCGFTWYENPKDKEHGEAKDNERQPSGSTTINYSAVGDWRSSGVRGVEVRGSGCEPDGSGNRGPDLSMD